MKGRDDNETRVERERQCSSQLFAQTKVVSQHLEKKGLMKSERRSLCSLFLEMDRTVSGIKLS